MPALSRRLRGAALDPAPLRTSRDFRLLWSGQLISMLGRQITVVAVPYQVYVLTHSALAVGALGAVQVVPLLCVSLYGGALVDRVDRRRLLLATNLLLAACSAALALAALLPHTPVLLLYAVTALISAFSAVDQPARSATVPALVEPAQLAAAMALMFGLFQLTVIGGPVLGGVVIARFGLGSAYLIDVATFAASLVTLWLLRPQPPRHDTVESPLRAIRTGLRHLRESRAILGSFVADIDAMLLGMPRALFPVLAITTFHAGPQGLGLLYAALAVGGVVAVLGAGVVGGSARRGRVVVLCVGAWGIAIALFGSVTSLWLALPLLAVAGAADAWSAVARSTLMQESTPDHLRGRLSSVYSMVVVGGPNLGDVRAGAMASLVTPAVSVVSGGLLCVAGLGLVCAAFPELWRHRATPPATTRAASAH